MTQAHVTPNNPVTTDIPVGGLDNEEYSHALPFNRVMWPTSLAPTKEVYDVTTLTKGGVWIEIGHSPLSLMPFASGASTHIAFDERPWTKPMMDRGHDKDMIKAYISAENRFVTTPGVNVLHELTRICENLDTSERVGLAFFVICRLGGISRRRSTLSASLDCSGIKDKNAVLMLKRYSLMPQHVMPPKTGAEDVLALVNRVLDNNGEGYHVNINRPLGKHTLPIAKGLTKRGYSWSILIQDEDRTIARDMVHHGYRADKIGSNYYVTME